MNLRLVTPSGTSTDFQPTFTYAIFGDEEKVFGYKDLKIKLYFASGSLYCYLGFTYAARVGEGASKRLAPGVQPQDIVGMVNEKIVDRRSVTHNLDDFLKRAKRDEATFQPMGSKMHEYTVDGRVFEMYECDFETPRFKQYHRSLQLFLVFFIEGASYVDEDDLNWKFVLLFERCDTTYKICGYMSYYSFFHYPDKLRMRISQFLILPPFQKQGHGRRLYQMVFDKLRRDPEVHDITVEDPNDGFQDMRDKCDVERMLKEKALAGVSLPLKLSHFAKVQQKFKLSKMQSVRCSEMVFLKRINRSDQNAFRKYRLYLKGRIYKKNKDTLEDMDFDERLNQPHSTFLAVLKDYQNVLDIHAFL